MATRPKWAVTAVVGTPFYETWKEHVVVNGLLLQAQGQDDEEGVSLFTSVLDYLTHKGQAQLLGIEVSK